MRKNIQQQFWAKMPNTAHIWIFAVFFSFLEKSVTVSALLLYNTSRAKKYYMFYQRFKMYNAEDKNLKNIGESLSTCYFPPL